MKFVSFILWFLIVFVACALYADHWFSGAIAVKALFSLTIAALVVVSGFGLIDIFMPEKKDK